MPQQPGELSRIRLFGNGLLDEPLHHYAFWHGRPRELATNALIGIVQRCPGMIFDLDCGCGHDRDTVVSTIYGSDADSGVVLSIDEFQPPKDKRKIVAGMLEGIGVKEVRHLVLGDRDPLEEECPVRQMLIQEPKHATIFFGPDRRMFVFTHDIPVRFRDGGDARLLVFREPPKPERRGYNRTWKTYYVLAVGDINGKEPVTRYHSECVTADHGSNACDCNTQRTRALGYMRENGSGVFIHAPEDGMNLGKVAKLPQTFLTLGGESDLLSARELHMGIPGDTRDYYFIDIVRQVFGIQSATIASNNLSKRQMFEKSGIQITGQYPMEINLAELAPQAAADVQAKINSGRYIKY